MLANGSALLPSNLVVSLCRISQTNGFRTTASGFRTYCTAPHDDVVEFIRFDIAAHGAIKLLMSRP